MNPQTSSTALSADLDSFIYGVSRRNSQNAPELTKIGISLLKSFPAARDAVLEYFAMVFHDAVNVSINQSEYESDISANGSLESVSMIGPELCSLGQSWAPFIAPWCINLIMDIATKKSNIPNATLQSTDPVRTLLDMTTQNLTLLNSEERAKCIDMMLGSWACSWAVGWVGRAEPALVAPRALALGAEAARAVLQHLAQHPPALLHVRAALIDLFQEAIKEDSKMEKKRDVIPYLLNLASKSDIVLKALTQDIEFTITDEVMDRLCYICSTQRHTPAWEGVGPASLVALLLRSDVRCLLLLMKFSQRNLFCRQLLEYLLQKLEFESLFPDKTIPLLTSAAEEINIVREKLLTGNKLEQYSLARILILVCYNLPSEFVSTLSYLLQYSRSDTTLALIVRIISGTITMHVPNDTPDINMDTERYQSYIKTGVEYALRDAMISDTEIKKCFIEDNVPKDQKTYLHHYCLNIIKLLRWENSNQVSHLRTRPIGRAVEANLYRVGGALKEYCSLLRLRPQCTMASLDEMPTCHALAEVLDRVDMSGTKAPPPSVEVILKVVQATVKYFFRCLHEKDVMEKLRGVQTSCRLLRKLCVHSKLARAVALRDLLETAMFREEKAFGSRPVVANTVAASKDWTHEDLLVHLNQKHGPITQLTQSHTSVFHAGIIGKGVRKQSSSDNTDEIPPILTTNNELLMGALMSCMFYMVSGKGVHKHSGADSTDKIPPILTTNNELSSTWSVVKAFTSKAERTIPTRYRPYSPPTASLVLHGQRQRCSQAKRSRQYRRDTAHTRHQQRAYFYIITGKGVHKQSGADNTDEIPPILTTNNELLMGALMSCMDGNSGVVEGATSVSLLLVELVSPDVMYNGLPWPDEDFTKQVSIERELYMRGALEGCAVARCALRRCAAARPALCLASALLRATAATLLHRLRALLDRHTQSAEMARERAALSELLGTMTLGQLLPHPLGHMLELAPELTASEIVQVLRDCLWNYTRDHVPSPALFTCDSTGLHWRDPVSCKPPATYTDTLRLIIQKRIARLGPLYPIMFLNLEKDAQ